MHIFMTVFLDAVRLEIQTDWHREQIGWFSDEVSAVAAAFECSLIRSAILPELRRMLPEVIIECEYKDEKTGREIRKYARGTTCRLGPNGRRVVRRPGALASKWLH